ncbi:hypothetical protein K474DRAFT_197490 [Panus rudis PR-1116 ss-1]|nr:hypothetical protein K474DRAFT_197490 [Panus rudis PR-1116 ss-1]
MVSRNVPFVYANTCEGLRKVCFVAAAGGEKKAKKIEKIRFLNDYQVIPRKNGYPEMPFTDPENFGRIQSREKVPKSRTAFWGIFGGPTLGAQTQSPYTLHPVTQQPVVDWDSTNPTDPQYFTYTVGGQRVPHPDRDALRNPTQMEDRKVYYKDKFGRYWLHPVDNWKWYAQTSGTTARRHPALQLYDHQEGARDIISWLHAILEMVRLLPGGQGARMRFCYLQRWSKQENALPLSHW